VGDWSPCTVANGSAVNPAQAVGCTPRPGVTTRDVVCVDCEGRPRTPSDCSAGGRPPPPSSQSCVVAPAATCTTPPTCIPPREVLNATSNTCVCGPGWGGPGCDIPLLLPPSGGPPCLGGVVDLAGTCCLGFVDAVTGACCGEDPVDREGRCCPGGALDVCGVCNGAGVAVDAQGACCTSPLPPSGLCCVDGALDSCGACGGDNTCG
jgi:hypothetical protein